MNTDDDILGINPGHDATVVLIRGGKIVEAMSEERLSRIKHHEGFPFKTLTYIREKHALKSPKVFIAGKKPLKSFIKKTGDKGGSQKYHWHLRATLISFSITRAFLVTYDRFFQDYLSRLSGSLPFRVVQKP